MSWAVVGAAVLLVVAVAGQKFVGDGAPAATRTALNMALALGIPIAWGLEVRWHRGRAALDRERARQAQRLAELERDRAEQAERVAELNRAAAVAAERARMARDLHDVIAGQLSAIAIAIQSEAALTLPAADPAALRRVLTAVRENSVASLAEMRTMIGLLRAQEPADGDPRTAPAGLDRLDTLLTPARASGQRIVVDDRRRLDLPVAAAVDLAAFRIVQES